MTTQTNSQTIASLIPPKLDGKTKRFYWLLTGQVYFTAGDGNVAHHVFNTVNVTKHGFLPRAELGKAQQAFQMRLMREVVGENVPEGFKILDVVVLNVNQLGPMTEREFHEGYDDLVKEQAQASGSILAQQATNTI